MSVQARAAYMSASVSTASPAKLLVMLCDRLVLDVRRALDAQQSGDHVEAHNQLIHAQDIMTELRTSLNPDGFEGGKQLAALYDWVAQRLVLANIRKDSTITGECLTMVSDIAETWRAAAAATGQIGG